MRRTATPTAIILAAWLLVAASAAAGEPTGAFEAEPEAVSDGDTVRFPEGPCRLIGIDAPELAKGDAPGQPLAEEARLRLRGHVEGMKVTVIVYGTERWGRRLCLLLGPGGELVNLALVQAGLAEVYRDFPRPFAARFDRAERQAKQSRRGIWGLPTYERPADYRRRMRSE